MTKEELKEYIATNTYNCCYCSELKERVIENGVDEIGKYNGMVCGGVISMREMYFSIVGYPKRKK